MGIRSDLLAETRRALCKAAMQLFVERGIAATRVEDILKGSGISVGSFYYLFKNKLDLAANLYLETQTQLYQSLLREFSRHEGAQEGIEALVRGYLSWTVEHPQEMYYLLYRREVEIIEIADEQGKAPEREFHQRLQEWLQVEMTKGVIRELPFEQCLALWLGPTMYLVRLVLAPYGSFLVLDEKEEEEEVKGRLLGTEGEMGRMAWGAMKLKGGEQR